MKKTDCRKIALYGGSFDPVHNAHLGVATAALTAGVDEVVFIPAANSPLKGKSPSASGSDRLQMLEIALGGQKGFSVDDFELKKGGASYTIETVSRYRERNPRCELYLIIGGDQFIQLGRWHRIDELLRDCVILVAARPDYELVEPALAGLRWSQLGCSLSSVSSTALRELLSKKQATKGFLHPAVEAFIWEKELYIS